MWRGFYQGTILSSSRHRPQGRIPHASLHLKLLLICRLFPANRYTGFKLIFYKVDPKKSSDESAVFRRSIQTVSLRNVLQVLC
jgi:hypothetical protein